MMTKQIWTIGHSNRTFEEFTQALQSHGVEALVDVRRYPGSNRYPQFNKEALERELKKQGISYRHFEALGGRRKTRPDSKNTAWKNKSFRGYADYMETPEFQRALDELKALSEKNRAAIMCSEAVWWSCHRSLIADALKLTDFEVLHIMSSEKIQEHPFTSPARVANGKLSYGSDQLEIF